MRQQNSRNLKDTKIEGKMPPQNVELEEIVLGACLLEKQGIDIATEILTKDSFYNQNHAIVFEACKNVYHRNEPVDIMTVVQELRTLSKLNDVGGPYFVSQLTNRVASSANTEYHCRIIQQNFLKRQLISESTELIGQCYDDSTDVFELYDMFLRKLMNLESGINQDKVKSLSEITHEQIKLMEKIKNGEQKSGIKTPFEELDKIIGGWYGGEFYIFAARPGMGKSILGKEIAIVAAKLGHSALIVNLEMNDSQSFHRIASGESDIALWRFRNAELEQYQWDRLMNTNLNLPIFFHNEGNINIIRMFRMTRKMIKEKNIKILIVDYLQLMEGSGDEGTREQEISKISRGLKMISKEFNIPVIAFSQLSRKVEERPGKIPMLSDLRESGSLEQDADIVGFIHRPEKYGLPLIVDGQEFDSTGKGVIIIAKNRQGKTGEVMFQFEEKTASFRDMNYEKPTALTSNLNF